MMLLMAYTIRKMSGLRAEMAMGQTHIQRGLRGLNPPEKSTRKLLVYLFAETLICAAEVFDSCDFSRF